MSLILLLVLQLLHRVDYIPLPLLVNELDLTQLDESAKMDLVEMSAMMII